MQRKTLSLALAFLLSLPVLAQQEDQPPAVPDYVEELRELAKLRDEGIITTEEFELKKRSLLGIAADPEPSSAEESQGEGETEEVAFLIKHCKKGLLSLMKSPASTEFVSVSTFPSPDLPRAMKHYVADGQSRDAPGTTVYMEYDSANSFGALLRGKISCDYTDPPYFMNSMAIIPRTVFLQGEPLSKNKVTIFGIDASLEMIPEFSDLNLAKKGLLNKKKEP
jgi:hypothetical protein